MPPWRRRAPDKRNQRRQYSGRQSANCAIDPLYSGLMRNRPTVQTLPREISDMRFASRDATRVRDPGAFSQACGRSRKKASQLARDVLNTSSS
jgi:hypothetical protein